MSQSTELVLSDRVSACDQNIVSDMGGEKVMLSVRNGNYYNLGSIGGRIWELIEEETPIGQIVERLLQEYEVDADECASQVLSFLEHLRKEGLILVHEEAEDSVLA